MIDKLLFAYSELEGIQVKCVYLHMGPSRWEWDNSRVLSVVWIKHKQDLCEIPQVNETIVRGKVVLVEVYDGGMCHCRVSIECLTA